MSFGRAVVSLRWRSEGRHPVRSGCFSVCSQQRLDGDGEELGAGGWGGLELAFQSVAPPPQVGLEPSTRRLIEVRSCDKAIKECERLSDQSKCLY